MKSSPGCNASKSGKIENKVVCKRKQSVGFSVYCGTVHTTTTAGAIQCLHCVLQATKKAEQ